uniref:Uncharacterized protein n=1 Tax=viral metagenome TaxID=1070528 RepID=A0A6M3M2A2_9ZZZZ
MSAQRHVGFIPIFKRADGAVYCRTTTVFDTEEEAKTEAKDRGWSDRAGFLTIGKVAYRKEVEDGTEG